MLGLYTIQDTIIAILDSFLFQFFVDSGTIEINPSTLVCKNYPDIVIRCSLKGTKLNTGLWKNIWTHALNGQHIRHPDISINGLISTLTINACSFQDRGNYTCRWYSDTIQYNSTTSVDVVCKYM